MRIREVMVIMRMAHLCVAYSCKQMFYVRRHKGVVRVNAGM